MTLPPEATPKFSIGDTIWVASTKEISLKTQCSSCLGAGEWVVTTPAGEEVPIQCPDCRRGYFSDGLTRKHEHVPIATPVTVTGIEVDTSAMNMPENDWRPVIRYQSAPNHYAVQNCFEMESLANARALVLAAKAEDAEREHDEYRCSSDRKDLTVPQLKDREIDRGRRKIDILQRKIERGARKIEALQQELAKFDAAQLTEKT